MGPTLATRVPHGPRAHGRWSLHGRLLQGAGENEGLFFLSVSHPPPQFFVVFFPQSGSSKLFVSRPQLSIGGGLSALSLFSKQGALEMPGSRAQAPGHPAWQGAPTPWTCPEGLATRPRGRSERGVAERVV